MHDPNTAENTQTIARKVNSQWYKYECKCNDVTHKAPKNDSNEIKDEIWMSNDLLLGILILLAAKNSSVFHAT